MCTPQLCEFSILFVKIKIKMFCTKSNETEKSSVWRAGVLLVIEWKEDLTHAQKFPRNFVYNCSVSLEASHSNGIFPDLN